MGRSVSLKGGKALKRVGGGSKHGGDEEEFGKVGKVKYACGLVLGIHAVALPAHSDFPFFGNLPSLVPASYPSFHIQVIDGRSQIHTTCICLHS